MCLDSVGGGDDIQEVTLNLLRRLKRYLSRIAGTSSSCSSSIVVFESMFIIMDSWYTLSAK